jgi:hypothetical protein
MRRAKTGKGDSLVWRLVRKAPLHLVLLSFSKLRFKNSFLAIFITDQVQFSSGIQESHLHFLPNVVKLTFHCVYFNGVRIFRL